MSKPNFVKAQSYPYQEGKDFVFHTIPSQCNGLRWKDAILDAKGYDATYHLKIRLSPIYQNNRLAVKIGYVNTAYSLFLQGENLGGVGK